MPMVCPAPGGECLVVLSAATAAQLAAGRDADELAVWAAFLTTLADNLALIAVQRAEQEARCAAARQSDTCARPQNRGQEQA